MPNLYKIVTKSEDVTKRIDSAESASIYYHNIFDYPLDLSDLIKWKTNVLILDKSNRQIKQKNGFFFLEGNEGVVYKRSLRKRISERKMEIAKKAGKILSIIPTIKMVAVTGSLAMENASTTSDIDLMLVTSKDMMWTTRFFSYLFLKLANISVRKFGDKDETNKLCLNIWIDESDTPWPSRNIYTAHEIAQIIPLINRDNTYEKFLKKNKWILEYWPNAVRMQDVEHKLLNKKTKLRIIDSIFLLVERLAFWLQYRHMKPKITREIVTPTCALFHPQDWSKVVLDRLNIGS